MLLFYSLQWMNKMVHVLNTNDRQPSVFTERIEIRQVVKVGKSAVQKNIRVRDEEVLEIRQRCHVIDARDRDLVAFGHVKRVQI